MNSDIFLPPQLPWATGALAGGPLIRKTPRLPGLPG
ncbi:glucose-6-phosphate isomerase, partial [Enterobacter hormaechei]